MIGTCICGRHVLRPVLPDGVVQSRLPRLTGRCYLEGRCSACLSYLQSEMSHRFSNVARTLSLSVSPDSPASLTSESPRPEVVGVIASANPEGCCRTIPDEKERTLHSNRSASESRTAAEVCE